MDIKNLLEIADMEEFQNLPKDLQEQYLNEFIEGFICDMEESRREYMEYRRKLTLAEIIFYTNNVEDMKNICREEGFRGFSKLRSQELADFIAGKRLEDEYLREFLLYLRDVDLELIDEMIANDNYVYLGLDVEFYQPLFAGGYMAVDAHGNTELATDFNEVYRRVRNEAFEKDRELTHWMLAVLVWIQDMYASAPAEIFNDLFRLGYAYTDEEIKAVYDRLPEWMKVCVFKDGKVIAEDAYESGIYLEIEKGQGDSPFYIPSSADEIIDLYSNHYLSKELKYVNLENWLMEYQAFDEEDARSAVREIWNEINLASDMDRIEDILDDYGVEFDTEEELESYMVAFTEAYINTRMLQLRGNKICDLEPDALELINRIELFNLDEPAEKMN